MHSVAIIIPSKNRPNYCLAQIKYYNAVNFLGRLVIIDSSSNSSFLELQEKIQKNNLINFELYNEPSLSTHQAIVFGLNKVKDTCSYFVFSGDDDYFVVDGIDKATRFLDAHPDFIGAVGKGVVAKHEPVGNSIRIGWVRTYWKPRNITDLDHLNRIRAISKNYLNLEFAVKRVSACIDNLTLMNQIYGAVKFDESTDLEICSTLSVALAGKIKFLRTRFLIRGDHDARPNLLKKYDEIHLTGKRKNNFVKYLSAVLNKYDNSSKPCAEKIINDFFDIKDKKARKRGRPFVRYYFICIRLFRKIAGLFLKYYYKRYFELFIRL